MRYTNEVFQRLSRGRFICSNSVEPAERAIYNDIEECLAEYADFFAKIDFHLSAGDGYYYFSRNETKVDTTNKLRALLPWIDYLDVLKTYDTTFDAGTSFYASRLAARAVSDIELKDKMSRLFKDRKSINEKAEALIEELVRQGYAEEVNAVDGRYQVTNAFRYIINMLECINIDEEIEDEIPE